jgi:hypothetical protein
VAFGVVSAQDEFKALLRANEDRRAPVAQRYFIEVFADVPLNQKVYDALGGTTPPQVGVLTSKGVPVPDGDGFNNKLLISPDDEGQRKRYRLYLPDTLAPFTNFDKKKFAVLLINYPDDADKPVVRAISVERVLVRELTTNFPLCRRNEFGLSVEYGDEDLARVRQLHSYLHRLQTTPTELQNVLIRVEPLSRDKVETRHVTGITIAPEMPANLDEGRILSACFATDGNVPSEKFDAQLILTTGAPVELAEPTVVTGLSGLSVEPFTSVFPGKEKAVGLRTIDKDLNVGFSLVSSVSDEEKPDKTIVRDRDTVGTLDLRLGFFRNTATLTVKALNVKDPTKDCGPVSAFTAATATTPGSITIGGNQTAIAAGLTLNNVVVGMTQCLHFKYVDGNGAVAARLRPLDPIFIPYISGDEPPDLTAGTYNIFTPFYIDAKVSTGKITKDTSSLNRVVFGLQDELRYYANNNHFPTYYRFVFQANHASDRDFKQREFKGTFEFHPIFGPWNHPFEAGNANLRNRFLCPACKPPFKLIPVRYGYEFVPVVGAEIGRTYHRSRPAEGVKPSDTVRRLYFGVDTTIYPTTQVSLTAVERFYIRGEKKDDRYHNYFLGEFNYRIGRFAAGRASQSVFFSWEKGGQPPFDDPDVNVFKIGYRISADNFFNRN